MKKNSKVFQFFLTYGIVIFLILLYAFFSVSAPNFFTTKTLITILKQVSINGIVAIGMGFVMICGGIDLSTSAVVALVNVVFCKLYVGNITGIPAIVICLMVGCTIGLFNAFVVNTLGVMPMIGTLGAATAIRGIAYIYTQGIPVSGMPKSLVSFAQASLGPVPYMVILLLVMFAVAAIILNKTKFGRHVYAVGGNAEAARLSGINMMKVKYTCYIISGACAAIAGMVLSSRTNSGQPSAADGYEMTALTSLVLGGISMAGGEGNILFLSVGLLITGVLTAGMTMMYISDFVQQVVQGLILIAALAFSVFSARVKAKNIVTE